MAIIKRRIPKSFLCPYSKRFESIMVCALDCRRKCETYKKTILISTLEKLIEKYPDYEIIGEFMARKPVEKESVTNTDKKTKEKKYWVIIEEGKYIEVTENEIIENPKEYLDKKILDKPPYEYELTISLRKKK